MTRPWARVVGRIAACGPEVQAIGAETVATPAQTAPGLAAHEATMASIDR